MLTLTLQPTDFSFARCRNVFALRSSDNTIPGSCASISFDLFDAALSPGAKFTLSVDGLDLVFMLDDRTPIPDLSVGPAYRFLDAASLLTALQSSVYLSDCTISRDHLTSYDRFSISFRTPGHHLLSVSSSSDLAILVPGSYIPGTDSALLPNYRVAVRFQVSSLLHNGYTPWVTLDPVGDLTTIDTSILNSYLPDILLPSKINTFDAFPLSSHSIRYLLEYAEVYGDIPVFQSYARSPWHILMPGELEQSRADEFLPDWIDALPTAQLGNRPFFLGSDAGLTLSLFRSEVDYVYVYSHTDAAKLTASIQLYAESSEPVIYTHSIVIKPDTLHAIPLSPILMGAMPMHTAILFEVSDSSGNILFSRTIIIRDHHQLAAQLYLTDKYGLLRSFIPRSLSRSLSFEADQVLLRFSRTQAVTRRTETLSATSFPMPKRLADAVVDSLPNKAYILIGSSLYPVRIAPSTYSAYTSDQNLTTVTFDFFVESVQQHAIPYAPPRSIQSPIPDLSLLSESGQPIGTEQYEFITAEYIHQ